MSDDTYVMRVASRIAEGFVPHFADMTPRSRLAILMEIAGVLESEGIGDARKLARLAGYIRTSSQSRTGRMFMPLAVANLVSTARKYAAT